MEFLRNLEAATFPINVVNQVVFVTRNVTFPVCANRVKRWTFLSSAFRSLLLVSCLAYSSTLKIQAICSSEMLVILGSTRCYNPELRSNSLRFEKLKTNADGGGWKQGQAKWGESVRRWRKMHNEWFHGLYT
jgi:hypothetical protein